MSENKTDYNQSVHDFNTLFQREHVPVIPSVPNKERIKLRYSLIIEELHELAISTNSTIEFGEVLKKFVNLTEGATCAEIIPSGEENMRNVLDDLSDLQYVVSGAVVDFGLIGIFDYAFEEVHNSNMSKACLTEEEAQETLKFYAEKNVAAHYRKVDSFYVVYRSDDMKVLKSINYKKANLQRVVNSYLAKNPNYDPNEHFRV